MVRLLEQVKQDDAIIRCYAGGDVEEGVPRMSEVGSKPESESGFTRAIAILRTVLGQISRSRMSLISAGVAFFAMLSIFPGLAALVALLSLISDPEVVVVQLEQIRSVMPEDVYNILHGQIVGLVSTSPDTLGWAGAVSIAVALWSARAGVGALMQGLNAVYEIDSRATLRHYSRALLLTGALVAVGIIALMALVVAPIVLAFFPLAQSTYLVIDLIRWSVAIFVVLAGIGLLYRFGPNRKASGPKALSAGALFAGVSWALVSIAFSYYVRYFGSYNEVYGSISAVIAMLIWLWISSFLILLGGALNAALERQRAAVSEEPDTSASDEEVLA